MHTPAYVRVLLVDLRKLEKKIHTYRVPKFLHRGLAWPTTSANNKYQETQDD